MCQISNKLKLCTCIGTDVYDLKHYWTFHRFIEGKNEMLIGETRLPPHYHSSVDQLNYSTLLHILNSEQPFDVSLDPARGDRLCLSFAWGDDPELRVYYGFSFGGKKWRKKTYDTFDWMSHHTEMRGGSISDALL